MRQRIIVVCAVAAAALGIGVAGLLWPVASFAQKPTALPAADTNLVPSAPEEAVAYPIGLQIPQPPPPLAELPDTLAAESPIGLHIPDATTQRFPNTSLPTVQPPSGLQALLAEDPLRAAEQFVEKTSAEVSEAVDVLASEAESLRTRLQNVEAAQQRLQAVLRCIENAMTEPALEPGPQYEKP